MKTYSDYLRERAAVVERSVKDEGRVTAFSSVMAGWLGASVSISIAGIADLGAWWEYAAWATGAVIVAVTIGMWSKRAGAKAALGAYHLGNSVGYMEGRGVPYREMMWDAGTDGSDEEGTGSS